jgi:DNA-binding GntR family transcriptional regulator
MAILDNLEVPPSLKEMAFRSIKLAIMSNKIEAGRLYTEQSFAKDVGISKTPVREALLDLANKGFIEILPRRGFQVKRLTKKDIQDIYNVRIALETMVVRSITSHMTPADFSHIETIREREKKAIKSYDRDGYMAIDRELHFYLAGITRNTYLINYLENIRDLVDWMGFKALGRPERMAEVEQEHERIISYLKKGEIKKAACSMEEHICVTMQNVLQRIEL